MDLFFISNGDFEVKAPLQTCQQSTFGVSIATHINLLALLTRTNVLGSRPTCCTDNRLGQVSMKCKVAGIFGEKLVNIHFYII